MSTPKSLASLIPPGLAAMIPPGDMRRQVVRNLLRVHGEEACMDLVEKWERKRARALRPLGGTPSVVGKPTHQGGLRTAKRLDGVGPRVW